MTRTQLAGYCLIASAFVLGGLLVVMAGPRLASEAEASLVITQENFTLLTAKTRSDEEALFLIDNATQRLLIYRMDMRTKDVELVDAHDLTKIMAKALGSGGRGDGGRSNRGGAR